MKKNWDDLLEKVADFYYKPIIPVALPWIITESVAIIINFVV